MPAYTYIRIHLNGAQFGGICARTHIYKYFHMRFRSDCDAGDEDEVHEKLRKIHTDTGGGTREHVWFCCFGIRTYIHTYIHARLQGDDDDGDEDDDEDDDGKGKRSSKGVSFLYLCLFQETVLFRHMEENVCVYMEQNAFSFFIRVCSKRLYPSGIWKALCVYGSKCVFFLYLCALFFLYMEENVFSFFIRVCSKRFYCFVYGSKCACASVCLCVCCGHADMPVTVVDMFAWCNAY
jgi:hypothetical protein